MYGCATSSPSAWSVARTQRRQRGGSCFCPLSVDVIVKASSTNAFGSVIAEERTTCHAR